MSSQGKTVPQRQEQPNSTSPITKPTMLPQLPQPQHCHNHYNHGATTNTMPQCNHHAPAMTTTLQLPHPPCHSNHAMAMAAMPQPCHSHATATMPWPWPPCPATMGTMPLQPRPPQPHHSNKAMASMPTTAMLQQPCHSFGKYSTPSD